MGVEALYNNSFQGFVVTKTIAGILTSLFTIGFFFPSTRGILALVPGHTIPYVWNIFTSGFFEISFISLMMNLSALLVYGKFLENFWGAKEFTKFVILVNLFSGLSTFVLSMFLFMISGSLYIWFEAHPCGFGGIVSGFTIALKQLLPEEKLFPAFDFLRGKHTPALSLFISIAFVFAKLVPIESLSFTVFGLVFSWIYLRFYQVRNELIGDMNESFSFASFFPEFIQGPVRTFSTIIFNLMVLCKLCKPRVPPIPIEAPHEPTSIESERRRQRAQQMLDQKLQQMKQYGQTDISSSKSSDSPQLV